MSDLAELLAQKATIVEHLEDLEFELFAVLSGHDIPRENELKAQIQEEKDKLAVIDQELANLKEAGTTPLTVETIKSMDEKLLCELFDEIVSSLR